MDILLNKSESSLEASTLLHEEELYASSVHCSYYSSVQLMRHIIFNNFGEDEIDFDNKDEVRNHGSHNFLISFFKNRIYTSISKRDFGTHLRDLKELRKNADYKQKVILIGESRNAMRLSNIVNSALKRNFL